ncbi:MAG TPA: CoA ester lyase, partial [Galbitalea sp.]|nr:CoA ester lyase [Galbitalea sp.]
VGMEDTVPPARKLEGRNAVVAALSQPEYIGNRPIFVTPNAIDTKWGPDDLRALADCGVGRTMVPKVRNVGDVDRVATLFDQLGCHPDLIPIIETPGGVADVDRIASHERVVAMSFGEGDLSAALGTKIYPSAPGVVNPILDYARAKVVIAAGTASKACYDAAFVNDIKNLDEFRARVVASAHIGFTGCDAIYPPFIEIINEAYSPTEEEISHAHEVLRAYAEAEEKGAPAVQLADGTVLLIHDRIKAQKILARARH